MKDYLYQFNQLSEGLEIVKRQIIQLVLAAIAVVALGGTANALPVASLSFTNPTGTAAYTDSIPVWVTLTLQSGTGGLTTDGAGNVLDLTPADIVPYLFSGLPVGVDQNSATSSDLNFNFSCFGTFLSDCGGTPYQAFYNTGSDGPTLITPANLNLADGSSTDFLLFTYGPLPNPDPSQPPQVPAGNYSFSQASVFIEVFYTDATTLLPTPLADIPLTDILSTDPNATFSRDVAGPEPGTSVLMVAGLALVAGFVRRKAA